MTEFSRQPLALQEIDAKLHRHLGPDAAPKLKMMAARAMLPAPPEQLVRVLYQLQFEEDSGLRDSARKSLAEMPDAVLGPVVQGSVHPGLLDWVSEVQAKNMAIGGLIARNAATDDSTIVRMSRVADAELADIIATNQVRVLRTPAIIEGLYKNAAVSSATVDALVELAQRNQVELKGLPGLNAALRSGLPLHEPGKGLGDKAFSAFLQSDVERAEQEANRVKRLAELEKTMTRSELEKLRAGDPTLAEPKEIGDDEEEVKKEYGNVFAEINDMSTSEKIRTATVGSREAVHILVRDQNKLVHSAAIRSPRINLGDVAKFAANKSLPDGVIEYIANNRDWTQKYEVMKGLVNNPKTPLKESLKFLNHLRTSDLRDLGRSRNVSHQVARAAQALARKRSGG